MPSALREAISSSISFARLTVEPLKNSRTSTGTLHFSASALQISPFTTVFGAVMIVSATQCSAMYRSTVSVFPVPMSNQSP